MFFIIVPALILVFYLWWSSALGLWKKFNIPHVAPHFLWGNFKDVVYIKKSITDVYESIYRKFPDHPYVGVYIVNRPGLLLRDPELIKSVTSQNFSHFHNNDLFVDEKVDPIFGKNPFTSRDELWKQRRAIHTRQFSSGKIKYMFNMVIQGGDRLSKYLKSEINANSKFTVETNELASKYTLYNVGTCALGIDSMTFEDDNAEMRVMGRDVIEPNLFNGIKQFLVFILPNLGKFLSITIVPPKVTQRLKILIKEQLQYREENKIVRNDFFESIQEYKGERVGIEEMIVQVGGLFVDGFITTSAALGFILYELAVNLDVQRKLVQEVDEFLSKHKGEIPYEDFQSLSYLNGVFLEGLRKYPPLAALTKVCTQPFEFPPINKDGKPLPVQVGTPVVVPLIGLQNDEKYFSDPARFDPESHIGENKTNITKCSFMPFGDGPRSCIGERFALLQGKMMLFKLMSEFEIRLNAKTKVPLTFNPQSIILAAEGGIWVDIHKRDK